MKTAGMIFVFASLVLVGCRKSMQLGEAVRFWTQFGRFVQYAADAFRYQSVPVVRVIADYARTGAPFALPGACAERMRGGASPPEAWAAAVASCRAPLSADDRAMLTEFGAGLGATDLQGQLAHCALYAARAAERRDEARAAQRRKARLYPMLGAAAGLGLILLLA